MNTALDWAMLRVAAQEMEAYLLSGQQSWPVRGDARLTPGGWLLSSRCLQALPLSVLEVAERDGLIAAAERTRQRWRAAWRKKALADARQRVTVWRAYLQDVLLEERPSVAEYAVQVRGRAMLTLLEQSGDLGAMEQRECLALDAQLWQHGRPGAFVWEADCAAGFDVQQFWYLYYCLKG